MKNDVISSNLVGSIRWRVIDSIWFDIYGISFMICR